MTRRLNILLSAYFCSPYRGGESAVGWQTAIGLAKHHNVTLLCGDHAKEAPTAREIARYQKETGLPAGLQIAHVQARGLARGFHLLHQLPGLWFVYYEGYRRWQKQAMKVAERLHTEKPFDLVHHVNVIGFREPGYLWQMDLPFFWGPVSGAPMVSTSFLEQFSLREKFRWGSRNLMNALQIRLISRAAMAAKAASKVWVVSKEDWQVFARWGVDAEQMLETGSSIIEGKLPRRRETWEPLRLCWSGLFQGIKALPMLLRTMASIEHLNVTLDVLGDGVEADKWKKLADKLGLAEGVRWLGMLPRDEALRTMENAHVLVHTSVKEGTPHVVLEALAMGMPVICHDACGMGIAVNESCGIKIPMCDPATSIEGFKNAIERFSVEPDLLEQLSLGALRRASELSWESHIDRICDSYRTVLDAPDPNPQS